MKKYFITILLFILMVPCIAEAKRPINDVYVVFFILDGIHKETFNQALNTGKIPTIKKYFIDEGANFSKGLSIFPSVSSTAYPAFVSGLFPGHSGVIYLKWFDRTKKKPVNYFSPGQHRRSDTDFLNLRALLDPNEPDLYPPSTIFDYLEDYQTATIYSLFNRRSRRVYPTIPLAAGWAVFGSGREEMLDQYAINELNDLFDHPLEDIPRFTLTALYSFDSLGHHYGASSDMVVFNLERFDQCLADFINKLKSRNLFDKTYIILASDHGMHNVPRGVFDIEHRMKEWGFTPYPGHPRKPEFNVQVTARGVTAAHLYFKGSDSWTIRPTYRELQNYPLNGKAHIDVVQNLRDAPETLFTVVRDGFDRVRVLSQRCEGIISIRNFKYRYDVAPKSCDPLMMSESGAKKLVSRGYFDDRKWGELTANDMYPDAVVQLGQLFADGRGGDIFIIPKDDWVFYRKKVASHGSIIKDDMTIPFLLRGPTVPVGQFGFMRASDLYPTMLDWFGIEGNPNHYDGNHLFKKPKRRRTPTKEKSRKKLEMIYSRLSQEDDGNPARNANLWLIQQQIERLSD